MSAVCSVGDYRWMEYAQQIQSGAQVACHWMKQAAQRFLDDLESMADDSFRFRFDEQEAQLAVEDRKSVV